MNNLVNEYILVLPSWYPNKLSPYDGDFIQRHIKSIGLYNKQIVVYVKKDEFGEYTNDYFLETNINGNVTELLIYYKPVSIGIGFINQILSHIKYLKLYKEQVNKVFDENGMPKLSHVHIAYKAGIIANWIKRKWKIPFIITENSTIYLKEAKPNLSMMSIFYNCWTKKILKASSKITVVSNFLEHAIKQIVPNHFFSITPNVVDTSIFYKNVETVKVNNQFIFISNFSYQKNFPFLVEVVNYLVELNIEITIHCFGSYNAETVDLVIRNKVSNYFVFHGEAQQQFIAQKMQQMSALLICSKYETFGCVVIEANAAGLPVLATPTKPFNELIENGVNGIIANDFSIKAYAEVIKNFINNKYVFDSTQIAESANKYSYKRVGKQFDDIYKKLKAEN